MNKELKDIHWGYFEDFSLSVYAIGISVLLWVTDTQPDTLANILNSLSVEQAGLEFRDPLSGAGTKVTTQLTFFIHVS